MAKSSDNIKKVIDDLGIDISASDDAMFVVGRLDALASTIAARYLKRVTGQKAADAVLRDAAQKQPNEKYTKLLKRAASKVAALERIAETASYGELRPDQIRRANAVRSDLYDLMLKWLGQFDE